MPVTDGPLVPVLQEDALKLAVAHATDPGGRPDNEDAVLVLELSPPETGLLAETSDVLMAVADGMGGHEAGEIASRIAIDTLRETFGTRASAAEEMATLMKQAFREANERIYAESEVLGAESGIGTTLVAVATRGKYATIANVGDSRAYLIRADRLTQITKDHSLVQEQVAQGAIPAQDARRSPQRNVLTHALGQKPKLDGKLPSIFEITLLPEDRLLLCSDGFYDVVPDDDLLAAALGADPNQAVAQMIALAKDRGTRDNVTAVIADVSTARVREPALTGARGPSPLMPVFLFLAALIIIALIAAAFFLI